MESSSDYNDPWTTRYPPPVTTGSSGDLRETYRTSKSLFADFVPYISVHKAYENNKNDGVSGGIVFETTRVIFENIQETSTEAVQLLKTFQPNLDGKDSHLTFFGEQPKVYSFTGSLFHLDTKTSKAEGSNTGISPDKSIDANWYDNFRYAYNNILRGSKCAEKGLQVRASYDYRWSQGYLLNFLASFSSSSPGVVPFSFNMFVNDSGLYHKEDDISSSSIIDKL